jgi:hypothetical protein
VPADSMPNLAHLGANSEVRLPLARAQSMIRAKLQTEGWRMVVTGHSLGAAVACMLSFHLKDLFPGEPAVFGFCLYSVDVRVGGWVGRWVGGMRPGLCVRGTCALAQCS